MNRTLTRGHELKRLRAGYGANENEERKKAVSAPTIFSSDEYHDEITFHSPI